MLILSLEIQADTGLGILPGKCEAMWQILFQ